MMVALFKPNGTPFLADTATVFSTMLFVGQNLTDEAYALLMGGTYPLPYPLNIVLIHQTVESRNGLYQFQTGAPETTGPQPMKKVSNLPEGDALVGAVYALGETWNTGAIDADNINELSEQVREGSFLFASVDAGNARVWGTIFDGSQMEYLETRINDQEARIAALEG